MSTARARRLSLLPLLAVVLAACGGAGQDAASGAAPISTSAVDPGNAGGNKRLTVMSWNLYLGAELGPVFEAATEGDEAKILAASTAAWAMVVKNDFRVRAAAIADQIASARPELVGLQEAYTWRLDGAVVFDYVGTLVDELAARGLRYRVAATAPLSDFAAPVVASASPLALALVRGTDSEVILAREDVRTANPAGHVFANLLPLDVPGQAPFLLRGWASVDVKHQGVWLHLASTHLEAFHPFIRLQQAQELAAALDEVERPVVLIGDLNSDPEDTSSVGGVPNAAAYQAIVTGAGLGDAWLAVGSGTGDTSPYPEDLTVPEISLDERIDFVLFRGALTPETMDVLGTDPEHDRVCGVNLAEVEVCLWPSDHAGLRATLRLENPRFLALPR